MEEEVRSSYRDEPKSYGTANVPIRSEGSVMTEYGVLTKELDKLGECFDSLRVRLEPVTGPSFPTAEDGSKNPENDVSPLAASLRSDVHKVRNLASAIRNLTERIEV